MFNVNIYCLLIIANNVMSFFLSEEVVISSANNDEEMGTINDPLLRYTNHERYASETVDSAVWNEDASWASRFNICSVSAVSICERD